MFQTPDYIRFMDSSVNFWILILLIRAIWILLIRLRNFCGFLVGFRWYLGEHLLHYHRVRGLSGQHSQPAIQQVEATSDGPLDPLHLQPHLCPYHYRLLRGAGGGVHSLCVVPWRDAGLIGSRHRCLYSLPTAVRLLHRHRHLRLSEQLRQKCAQFHHIPRVSE